MLTIICFEVAMIWLCFCGEGLCTCTRFVVDGETGVPGIRISDEFGDSILRFSSDDELSSFSFELLEVFSESEFELILSCSDELDSSNSG